MIDPREFAYDLAFSRNLGWVTDWEQRALRAKSVAIAGLGGVGGAHLLALARLGIGRFTIADLDRYEIVNFNRQAGASLDSVGRPKTEVMEELARAINPELVIRRFDDGVQPGGIDGFLRDADLFVDGLDFFVLDVRRQVFARCAALGIPAVTAAPIGMGVGFLAFVPGGMTFEEYFRLEGQDSPEQYLRFLMGVAPRGLHRGYLVDPSRLDIAGRRGPSTGAACQLCAGVVATAAVKLLLGRGEVEPAPVHHHYDPFVGRYAKTRLARGNAGWLPRIKLALGRRYYARASAGGTRQAEPPPARSPIEEILDLGRWAPSVRNAQPWRFHIHDETTVLVSFDAPASAEEVTASALDAGMLLETLRIAATGFARTLRWSIEEASPLRLTLVFQPSQHVAADPLLSWITLRATDRRSYLPRSLTDAEKSLLATTLGRKLRVSWHETLGARLRVGLRSAAVTRATLRTPAWRQTCVGAVDWASDRSETAIPGSAFGLSHLGRAALRRLGQRDDSGPAKSGPITLFLLGELDIFPALRSAGCFSIDWVRRPEGIAIASLIGAGQRLQAFWLTATRLGLAMQPKSGVLRARSAATDHYLFAGRIGKPIGGRPIARATRRPLAALLINSALDSRSDADLLVAAE